MTARCVHFNTSVGAKCTQLGVAGDDGVCHQRQCVRAGLVAHGNRSFGLRHVLQREPAGFLRRAGGDDAGAQLLRLISGGDSTKVEGAQEAVIDEVFAKKMGFEDLAKLKDMIK